MPIEGIKLSISSAELKKLCEQRVTYHLGRAEWNKTKLKELEPTFKEAAEDAEEESAEQFKYGTSNARNADALEQFRARALHHRDRATVFRFMAEHVVINETYVLTEADLQKLEVIKSAW